MRIGEALAAKRGERGLSIEEVAASIRVWREHLRALEADDFRHFPASVYAGCDHRGGHRGRLARDPGPADRRRQSAVRRFGSHIARGLARVLHGHVKITSGKASATFITIDGHDLGPMGAGVATREFSSQTSP